MFLGLLDPDPLFRGTDPDPDPSMIKQNLDSYCFATSLLTLFLKNAVNVPSKSNTQKNVEKNSFFLASGRSMTKIAGSGAESGYGAGSIGQRHGSADSEPYQNVPDPQHWYLEQFYNGVQPPPPPPREKRQRRFTRGGGGWGS
jgi:hypothetical protein